MPAVSINRTAPPTARVRPARAAPAAAAAPRAGGAPSRRDALLAAGGAWGRMMWGGRSKGGVEAGCQGSTAPPARPRLGIAPGKAARSLNRSPLLPSLLQASS